MPFTKKIVLLSEYVNIFKTRIRLSLLNLMFVYLERKRSRPSLKRMTDEPLPIYITGKRNGPSPLQLTGNEE